MGVALKEINEKNKSKANIVYYSNNGFVWNRFVDAVCCINYHKTTLNTSPTSLTPIVPEDTVEQKVNKVSEQIENATQEFFQQQNAILNEKIEGNILINVKEGLDTIKDEINQKYTLEGFSIHVQEIEFIPQDTTRIVKKAESYEFDFSAVGANNNNAN